MKNIYKNGNNNILFKGGTSMMFFLGLDRMSVDLDFEFAGNNSSQEDIYFFLSDVIKKLGLIDKKSYIKKNTIFFLASYGGDRNIKIEVSTRRLLDFDYDIYDFYGSKVPVVDRSIQASFKLVAIFTRIQPRDLYDLNFYIDNNILPDRYITEDIYYKITGYKLSFEDIISNSIETVNNNIFENNILVGIGDLLYENQKNYVKKELKDDITMKLRSLY